VLGEQPPKVSGSDPDAPSQKRRVDIDVDLTWVQGQGPPVSDHSQAPDGSIEFCTIERAAGRVRYSGALPFGQVVFVQATWPLPDGWPLRWPPVAATRAAKLLWDQRTLSFGTLVFEARGTTGVTLMPVELEPDGCYLAAVATARGQVGAMLLEASASGAAHRSRSGKTGAVVAFCAQGADAGLLQVTARGTAVDYHLGLWQTGRIELGVSAP
jgi:hypothetical protein